MKKRWSNDCDKDNKKKDETERQKEESLYEFLNETSKGEKPFYFYFEESPFLQICSIKLVSKCKVLLMGTVDKRL